MMEYKREMKPAEYEIDRGILSVIFRSDIYEE